MVPENINLVPQDVPRKPNYRRALADSGGSTLVCSNCGNRFQQTKAWRKFCSRKCKNHYRTEAFRMAVGLLGIKEELKNLHAHLGSLINEINRAEFEPRTADADQPFKS